jgi:hypothetical protein
MRGYYSVGPRSALRLDDVPRGLGVAAARVDQQLRVLRDRFVVEGVVVGDEDYAVLPEEGLRVERQALQAELV